MKDKIIVFLAGLSVILIFNLYYSYSNTISISLNQFFFHSNTLIDVKRYSIYEKELQKINNSEKSIYSLNTATILCSNFLKETKDEKLKNKAFKKYRNYYFKVLKKIDINLYGTQCSYAQTCGKSEDNILDKNNYKILKFIKRKGYNLLADNNTFYLSEDSGFLLDNFANMLNPMWVEFLYYRLNEQTEGYNEKNYLTISYDEIKGRIVFWENFLKKYPDFPEKNEVKIRISQYLTVYLFGMGYSSIYEEKSSSVKPEILKSYQGFLKNNKSSKYYPYVKQYYEELQKNNFKYNLTIYSQLNNQLKKDNILKVVTDVNNNFVFDNGRQINF